jgi:hypothetical protein
MLKAPHLWHHLESQAQVASVFRFFASPAWLNERLNDIEASDSPIGSGLNSSKHRYPLVMTNIAMENGPFIDGQYGKIWENQRESSMPSGYD